MQGSGFRVQGAGFRVQGPGCRVQGSGCRVQGAGFRAKLMHVCSNEFSSNTRLGGWVELFNRNVQRFRGGLVVKAHRLLHHSTLGLGVVKKKKVEGFRVEGWRWVSKSGHELESVESQSRWLMQKVKGEGRCPHLGPPYGPRYVLLLDPTGW